MKGPDSSPLSILVSMTSESSPLCLNIGSVSSVGRRNIQEATPMSGQQAAPSLRREEIVSAMVTATKPKMNGFPKLASL